MFTISVVVMRKILSVALLAGVVSAGAPANAATYSFTFMGNPATDPGVTATGSFTTNAANDLVISGFGVFSFDPSRHVLAALVGGAGIAQQLTYDNVFPIDAAAGILFRGTSDPNFLFNIYAPTGTSLSAGVLPGWASAEDDAGYYSASLGFSGVCGNCTAQGEMIIAGVPEPGGWALMLIGFAALGVAALTRRRAPILALD